MTAEIKLPRVLDISSLDSIQKQLAKARSLDKVVIRAYDENIFCAGADLNLLLNGQQGDLKRFFYLLGEVLIALWNWNGCVVVEAVGKAVGGGVGFVSVGDVSIVSSNFCWRLAEVSLGFGPYVIGPFLSHRIGYFKLLDVALSCRWVNCEESITMGLVVPDGGLNEADLSNKWIKTIKKIAKPKVSPKLVKHLAETVSTLIVSHEVRNGIKRFLESKN
ncbi:MAG: enoyl-CoA hydratase-related protein [Deltaproteobacteria bacterium]|nr:enoyl-CoA hydratase-related protein [Deltaproteobacteria bacterium]